MSREFSLSAVPMGLKSINDMNILHAGFKPVANTYRPDGTQIIFSIYVRRVQTRR
jgi:hypothetical protein